MLPFESQARLCTHSNWPAWRPPRPKLPTTCRSFRVRIQTFMFVPSGTYMNVWSASGGKSMSQTGPIVRLLAVGAPVALVRPRLRVDDDDAAVAVAVGDEGLVGVQVDGDVGRRAEAGEVVAVAGGHAGRARGGRGGPRPGRRRRRRRRGRRAALAEGEQALAVRRALEDDLVHAPEPDVAVLVDVDAVLGARPELAVAGAAPGAHDVALRIELEHRRRRRAAVGPGRVLHLTGLALGQRTGAVGEPDVVALVDGDAGDLAEDPVVGQGLRPEGVYLEGRDGAH